MALTLAYTLGASLLVALTLVPAMSAGLIKRKPKKESKIIAAVQRAYGRAIQWVLRFKWFVLLGSVVLLVLFAALAAGRGFSMMPDMESTLKNYLASKKTGTMPYLGIVHRLDQPVEGVLVFAKNKRAAAGLTGQITSGSVTKEYLAVTDQKPENVQGHLEDYLKKDGKTNTSAVVTPETDGAKKAVLDYEVLNEVSDERTLTGKRILVRIQLGTGRHHQIRVQMTHAGMPLLGDRKYNPEDSSRLPLGLCSCHLVFRHPVTGKKLEFQVTPKGECFADFPNI